MPQATNFKTPFSPVLWLSFYLLLSSFVVFAQQTKPDLYTDVFTVVEHRPRYTGGFQAMRRYLDNQLRYPYLAAKLNISGKVYVMFIVEIDGQLTQVETIKGLGFGCDEEALRVVKSMPRWQPGKRLGRATRARCYVPIPFYIN